MKITITRILPVLLLIGLLVGCESEAPVAPDDSGELAMSAMKAPNAAASSTIDIIPIVPGIGGTSTLLRNENGVSFTVKPTGLTKGHVYTLWMAVFNNPENCVAGCDIADLFNPAVAADLMYSAGTLVGASGKATLAGHRNENDDSGSIVAPFLGLSPNGLLDARKAEIHFVVHSHGPKIPELVNEMLHSFNAGCQDTFDGIPVPEELGTYGPNTCADVGFAAYLP